MPIKPDEYTAMVNEVIDFKLQAVKDYIAEKIGPIGDIGSPEKFIGKKAAEWTGQDLQVLSNLYGKEPIMKKYQSALFDDIERMKKEGGG